MRIKFLSIIVSLLFVSFAISSCLNNEQVVAEYSTDATIRAFALDTVLGKEYPFSINQIENTIFNQNPLPVGSDTIINKILIEKLTTTSGVVILLNTAGKDSIVDDVTQSLNVGDSVDLRKPLKVKVMSMEAINLMYQGVPEDLYAKYVRHYTISVNIFAHDPDSLNWGEAKGEVPAPLATNFSGGTITGPQKSVIFNSQVFVYSKTPSNTISAYQTSISNPNGWTSAGSISGLPISVDLSTLLSFNNSLYAAAAGVVYYSSNGTTWSQHPTLNDRNVASLLVALPNNTEHIWNETTGIAAIAIDTDGTPRYCFTNKDATDWTQSTSDGEAVPANFPKSKITTATWINKTGVQGAMLVGGQSDSRTEVVEHTTPWATHNGVVWADLYTEEKFCPALTLPSIFSYEEKFYMFGNSFNQFYTSETGIAWHEANPKFCFPEGLTTREGSEYSMVVDSDDFVWIILSKSVTGTDDVWRFRLNKLNPEVELQK